MTLLQIRRREVRTLKAMAQRKAFHESFQDRVSSSRLSAQAARKKRAREVIAQKRIYPRGDPQVMVVGMHLPARLTSRGVPRAYEVGATHVQGRALRESHAPARLSWLVPIVGSWSLACQIPEGQP